MPTIIKPSEIRSQAFLDQERLLPFSYAEVGKTKEPESVPGYDNDMNFIDLGRGEAVWEAAKAAIRQWQMFPGGWACIWPGKTLIRPGEVVVMQANVMGLWWLNSCRIVYVIDQEDTFGFAYGTLPGHVERGEELFMVEKSTDGQVRYTIRAFSRPRIWAARLAYPVARSFQRKFVRDSKASMHRFVQNHTK